MVSWKGFAWNTARHEMGRSAASHNLGTSRGVRFLALLFFVPILFLDRVKAYSSIGASLLSKAFPFGSKEFNHVPNSNLVGFNFQTWPSTMRETTNGHPKNTAIVGKKL